MPNNKKDSTDKEVEVKKIINELVNKVLEGWIDVRMFGAVIPLPSDKNKSKTPKKEEQEKNKSENEANELWKKAINDIGNSISFTGPVQFSWAYSLNKVSLVDTFQITSHFKSKEENAASTMGRDYRVNFSLLAYYGIISGHRAAKTKLSKEDIKLLDEALVKAVSLTATTRSKFNQYTGFALRIEYKDKCTSLGDLRDYIKVIPKGNMKEEEIISERDFTLDVSELVNLIAENKDKIAKVKYYIDRKLHLNLDFTKALEEKGIKTENL